MGGITINERERCYEWSREKYLKGLVNGLTNGLVKSI